MTKNGTLVLSHTEGALDAAKPGEIATGKQPRPGWLAAPVTANDFLQRAIFNERESHLDWALFDYGNALRVDPASMVAQKHRGRLLLRLGQYAEAATALAGPEAAGDPEARYYLALATQNRNMMEALLPAADWAAPAAIKAAEWRAAAGDFEGALQVLAPAVDAGLTRAGAIKIALLRRLERWEEAAAQLAEWLSIDPTDSLLRYEQYRLGPNRKDSGST